MQIHLFGTDGLGNPVHLHPTTANDGTYSIPAPPGNYTACETVPAGYTQSFPTSGPSCSGRSGASGIGWTGHADVRTELDPGNNFGNYRPATISGTKFKDADAGGDKDAGEIGLGGWEIHLFGTDGGGVSVHQHTTTAADGTYSFTVKPGSYKRVRDRLGQDRLGAVLPLGDRLHRSHSQRNDHAGPAGYATVVVASGATAGSRDFGNTPLSRPRSRSSPLADLPNGSDATRAT